MAFDRDVSVEHGRKTEIEKFAEIVHEEHCLRLDVKIEEPLVPRPFRRRSRPKTDIISRAATRKIAKRRRGMLDY